MCAFLLKNADSTTLLTHGIEVIRTMPETLCKKCGSDLQPAEEQCALCNQSFRMECGNCDFVSDIQFHADCANAELFVGKSFAEISQNYRYGNLGIVEREHVHD